MQRKRECRQWTFISYVLDNYGLAVSLRIPTKSSPCFVGVRKLTRNPQTQLTVLLTGRGTGS
jgi:hypothetical protein